MLMVKRSFQKFSTVSNYMKYFLSIIEIENKKCHVLYKKKTLNELVSNKLIMSLGGLNRLNSLWQIDHPKYTALEKYTINLCDIFQKHFKK